MAREWNDVLLQGIREDFARPTVHARNLFHVSVAMYDAWAAYDTIATTYFLGKTVHGYTCPFNGIELPNDINAAREEAISYASYRLLSHRFQNSPGSTTSLARFDSLMNVLGYDISNITLDYTASPAGLGNYIALFLINYGLQDGSNEQGNYENLYYKPVNSTLLPILPGNPDIKDPNRWQPLTLDVFIDQSGNVFPGKTPEFQSPEWGLVKPFALESEDLVIENRDSNDYWMYHDPGQPPYLDTNNTTGISDEYKWNFELVTMWSSHLDPADTTMLDISPGSIGNVQSFPQTMSEYHTFYDEINGGDPGQGRSVNPITTLPYQAQFVKRADYARVLAEFWADGPDSETPPGHWFTLLNYVSDHPLLVKKFKGEGNILNNLEWDVKSYFALGGAVHDAAVASWGIKGYYDYIRPISALRYMADLGQSSDTALPNYHIGGVRLKTGFIELVSSTDPLAGTSGQNIDKIKFYAWKGPKYINDPKTDIAGVDWILAENWWPYQRPTFVTPPFAGYVSGHSTYSRAAAELITMFTGDEFFPGGIGQFFAKKDQFLVFEKGPSMNVTLQWATYRDASDQCSLSRIWGGIHPPADDIPGRLIGIDIGIDAFNLAETYFGKDYTSIHKQNSSSQKIKIYPNPSSTGFVNLEMTGINDELNIEWYDIHGRKVKYDLIFAHGNRQNAVISVGDLKPGMYHLILKSDGYLGSEKVILR